MRIMGLDYGAKTVGVALSDELLLTAEPKETIWRDRESKIRRTLVRIEELIEEYNVQLIVLGLPLNMDDSVGERARACLDFQDRLERRTGLPVVMSDERLTTFTADGMLEEMGVRPDERKRYIDQVAASIILEDYMKTHEKEIQEISALHNNNTTKGGSN
jgi:putative Holliday junction resolvase